MRSDAVDRRPASKDQEPEGRSAYGESQEWRNHRNMSEFVAAPILSFPGRVDMPLRLHVMSPRSDPDLICACSPPTRAGFAGTVTTACYRRGYRGVIAASPCASKGVGVGQENDWRECMTVQAGLPGPCRRSLGAKMNWFTFVWRSSQTRLLTLTGPAALGKTRWLNSSRAIFSRVCRWGLVGRPRGACGARPPGRAHLRHRGGAERRTGAAIERLHDVWGDRKSCSYSITPSIPSKRSHISASHSCRRAQQRRFWPPAARP